MTRLGRAALLLILSLLALVTTAVTTAYSEGAWVLWKHSYEVFVDKNKENHRRELSWKKVTAMAAKSDCDDRRMRDARAEYSTLTGNGVRATLTGSEVGFDQKNTRFKRGYRRFECWPDTLDPRGAKGK